MKTVKELREYVKNMPAKEYKKLDEGHRAFYYMLKNAYTYKEYLHEDILNIEDILWEYNYTGFIEALNEHNINKIIVSDKSTALQGTLILLIEAGFKLTKTIVYARDKEDASKTFTGLMLERGENNE